jgi:flagellar biosynthesis protein
MDEKKIRKAVALAYEVNSAAPRITGQGEGFVAEAILARAKEFGIPTKTEPELVEFLMQLKLNELVPPKLYAAVAEVLAWAYEVYVKSVPNPNNSPIDSR